MQPRIEITPDMARAWALGYKSKMFIGAAGAQTFSRTFSQRSIEVYPEIFSASSKFLHYKAMVRKEMHKVCPVDILESGFHGPTAIGSNFSELSSVSGAPMNPMTYTPLSNEGLREELKLCSNFISERHRKILTEFINVRYEKRDDARGKISRVSSSGFPFFSHDITFKVKHLNYLADNGQAMIEAFMKDDKRLLFDKFGVTTCPNAAGRGQAEGGSLNDDLSVNPKERLVNDLDYALSSGRKGRRFAASKRVTIDGATLEDNFAVRQRTVFGVPNAINAACSAAVEGLRHYADNTFGATYKTRGHEDLERSVSKMKFICPLDVSQYDQSMPWFLVSHWVDTMPFTEGMRKIVTEMLKSPKFYSSVNSIHDPVFTGDPMDSRYYNQWSGLPSGAFLTSMLGKDMFSFAILCMYDDYYHDVIGRVKPILLGEYRYNFLNSGDDSIVGLGDEGFRRFLMERHKVHGSMSPYFKVELENGGKYLGGLLYIPDLKHSDVVKACGDVASFFKNDMCPEKSVTSKLRPFGVYGLKVREDDFSSHPMFHIALEIKLKWFRDIWGYSFYDHLDKHMVLPPLVSAGFAMSQADIDVTIDPNKMHYKYLEEEISPEVLSTIEEKISERNTEIFTKLLTTR